MPSLKSQLKQHRHHPAMGAMSDEAFSRVRARLQEAIGQEPTPSPFEMYAEYAKWSLSRYLSKPIVAGAFSVAVVASGWMTTVSAADSLPGDRLYSVKMVAEKAQLKLASLDRKAVLHTEFAGRRLQEAADLQSSSSEPSNKDALVRGALEAYKQEVSSAGTSLRQLKDEGDKTALATATSVQQSLQTIDTTIDEVFADSSSPEATQDALAAKETTKDVHQVATTVAVEVHEEEQSELSARELKQMFKSELGQIEARQRFDLERIEVIRLALADETVNYENFQLPTNDDLLAYEYPIVAIDSQLSQAMSNFAAGGYRSAFEMLQEIDSSLLGIEAELAQIEITIMEARQQSVENEIVTDEPIQENESVEPTL